MPRFGGLGAGSFARLGAGSGGGSFALSRPTLTDLTDATDTGASTTDNITSSTAPDFSINWGSDSILENDTIEVKDSGVLIVSHTVTAGEEITQNVSLGLTLAEGSHSITIRHVRGALVSGWSAPYSLTVDTTAPALSSPGGSQASTDSTASLSVSTNEGNGTLYYVVTGSATPPTKAQVKAGQNNGSSAAIYAGSQAISSSGVKTATATGVTTGTRYAYYMHEDLAGNQSSVSASSSWSQADITAPVLSSPTGTKTGSTTANLGVTTNEGNGTLYGVLTLTSTPPTAAQIAAGQNAAGAAAAYAFNQAVSASGAQSKSATGLSVSTTYYAHYVQDDAASNRSNVVSASSFTTDAGSISITATATKLDSVGGTSITYNSGGDPSIGTANANRVVAVAIFARMGATISVASVSIAGIAATQVSGAACANSYCASDIWYASIPTGATATISVTYNGSTVASAIAVYSIITSTPTPSGGNNSVSSSASALNAALAIPTGGALISIVGMTNNPGSASFTWSTSGTAIVEDYDAPVTTRCYSSAHDTADAGTTPTITATYTGGGGANNMNLSLAAWGP